MSTKLVGQSSSFNQRCSLWSQYLKEKGCFEDLCLGNASQTEGKFRPVATTLDLFPVAEKHGQVPVLSNSASMDLFPREEDLSKMSISSANKAGPKEPEPAQMTIFYGGKVIVFNDFSADMAKEVMQLASKASSIPGPTMPQAAFAGPIMARKSPSPEFIQRSEPVAPRAYLPIAPRASLQRFLEKRKDRLRAKAPYLVGSSPASSKPAGNTPWLGLSAQ